MYWHPHCYQAHALVSNASPVIPACKQGLTYAHRHSTMSSVYTWHPEVACHTGNQS